MILTNRSKKNCLDSLFVWKVFDARTSAQAGLSLDVCFIYSWALSKDTFPAPCDGKQSKKENNLRSAQSQKINIVSHRGTKKKRKRDFNHPDENMMCFVNSWFSSQQQDCQEFKCIQTQTNLGPHWVVSAFSRDIQPDHDLAIFSLHCRDVWAATRNDGCCFAHCLNEMLIAES